MQETPNLKLKKPDLTDYVNVGDLNENADKIDTAITENKEDLATHLAEKATDAHNATNISLSSSNFTSDNVKEGMDELFTNVSDGKNAIASAITDKGQDSSGSDSFTSLANSIRNIEVGDYKKGDNVSLGELLLPVSNPVEMAATHALVGIIKDGEYFYVSFGYRAASSYVSKLDLSGNLLWRTRAQASYTRHGIHLKNGEVRVIGEDGIQRYDKDNGGFIGIIENSYKGISGSGPHLTMVIGDMLYINQDRSYNYNLAKIDLNTGELIWNKTESTRGTRGIGSGSDGYIYAADREKLYKIDSENGDTVWERDLSSELGEIVGAVFYDDFVYLMASDGRLAKYSLTGYQISSTKLYEVYTPTIMKRIGNSIAFAGREAPNTGRVLPTISFTDFEGNLTGSIDVGIVPGNILVVDDRFLVRTDGEAKASITDMRMKLV